ncbi:SRPBCC domain-containing protein [Tundrisphaera sp. TA3]|uniref:SRPBCC domain-containing protein n=1 Tax=Tundrisphaera sp. TA3 TaxID=3435775 RepID=UPI003EBF7999
MTTFSTKRTFAASPGAIFDAFQDPDRLARWWGPAGFTNTFETFEFRSGGRWAFAMHGPDGTTYPNESTFESIVPGREIVIRHAC